MNRQRLNKKPIIMIACSFCRKIKPISKYDYELDLYWCDLCAWRD